MEKRGQARSLQVTSRSSETMKLESVMPRESGIDEKEPQRENTGRRSIANRHSGTRLGSGANERWMSESDV
jgi:hypothetical protein